MEIKCYQNKRDSSFFEQKKISESEDFYKVFFKLNNGNSLLFIFSKSEKDKLVSILSYGEFFSLNICDEDDTEQYSMCMNPNMLSFLEVHKV